MTRHVLPIVSLITLLVSSCAAVSGGPRKGGEEAATDDQKTAMAAIGSKVKGTIVWSSSRIGNHDIFKMNADGSDLTRLTASDHVDWFPRFSPDGKKILFIRSKKGWVSEKDANRTETWDQLTMDLDGRNVTRVAENASWGNWRDDERIIFVRGSQIVIKVLASGDETIFLDGEQSEDLAGLLLQQPQLSPDGRMLALTLRGGRRATGIWNNDTKTWLDTGEGCQINWFPDGKRIYWVNPSGNGGSEVFTMEIVDGKPAKEYEVEELRYMDIPGRRSHEYFPQMSDDATWMVWAATQRGHDHDVADYEIYIWQVGAPPAEATRLTFHSGNDRWPDIALEGVLRP
ncbi:MAG: hypothetical protein V3T05_01815 [Myxococcota bacterium]